MRGGGGLFLGSENSNCQVLFKFQFGEGEYSGVVKTQIAKSCPIQIPIWGEGGILR